ncbi:MAG: DEAD/DEAH box helicase [Phycisphaerales bacterium]|nr:DEAD/DEAH box helicase [Phycisphaerales bacterium]MCB9863236.1 DEAD/DEAH box helicase [Phycisphaerales bacterium]
MLFEDLRLIEPLLRAVRAEGYETPTPIQVKAIPVVLEGRDVLGCAQTGTGKTAAFALPVLQRLTERSAHAPAKAESADPEPATIRSRRNTDRRPDPRRSHRTDEPASRRPIRAVVLCPTRELAQQIHASFVTYGRHTRIRATAIFGGVNQGSQVRALRDGVDVVIATPGRLLDLMNQGFVNLAGIEVLIMDEADHMLDMGFLPDIRRILGQLPKERQSLLFSATMPAPIRALANDMLRNPVPIQVAPVSTPAARVSHSVYHVDSAQKTPLLVHLLDRNPGSRTLVFTRTKRGADKLAKQLSVAGVSAAAIHGNKSQAARNRALAEFRSARTPVLVATDLAARGLDVDDIGQVFNYDLTNDPETYVHRIGRTGRAGASGVAVSFCTHDERGSLRAIEKLIRAPLEQTDIPAHAGIPARSQHDPSSHSRDRSGKPSKSRRSFIPNRDDSRRPARRRRSRGSGGVPRSKAPVRS